jgi:hypothetical protein
MTEPNDPIVTTPTIGAQAPAPAAAPTPVAAPAERSADSTGQTGPQDRPSGADPGQAPNGGPGQAPNGGPGMAPNGGPGQATNGARGQAGDQERGTTAAQLRRFIKSRPYVPMHELRRRFELNGDCDDVVSIETPDGRCYIGLPEREGRFMGDLVRQGEVGIELGHDPEVPIVVGVFPMRPVGR